MITVFGSINVDLTFRLPHLPAVGETVLTPAVTQAVGGKGANQAIAAARDGAATLFIGCVGADDRGLQRRPERKPGRDAVQPRRNQRREGEIRIDVAAGDPRLHA